MSEYKIEKNVPIPKRADGGGAKYPLKEMEIGDSFYSEVGKDKIASAISYYGVRNNKKFSYRKDGEGLRVWRIS